MTARLSIRRRVWLATGAATVLGLPALLGVLVNAYNANASFSQEDTLCWWSNGNRLTRCGTDSGGLQPLIYVGQALLFVLPLLGLLWLASWWATRPLRAWARAVDAMGPSNLGQRLDPVGPRDAARDLATSVDRLMDRVANGYEAQRRFAANASHELRTPLAVQRTLVEVAMDDPDARAHLEPLARLLLSTNERNERLIEGLVALADSDRGLVGAAEVPLDVIVAKVVDSYDDAARDAGVTVALDRTDTWVHGDEVLLERLVANLVHNAIKYNHDPGHVHVEVTPDHLAVTNTGPVIEPDTVPRLFEPFRRGNGERLDHQGGAGLGLAIVNSIVTAHGATLTAQAQPDGGLRIVIAGLANAR